MVKRTDDKADGERRPGRNAEGKARRAERDARLATALRDNLARRKAQARARDDAGRDTTPPED